MLHLTRALLAAAITLTMAPSAVLCIDLVERVVKGRTISMSRLVRLAEDFPEIIGYFGILLLLIAVPMVILWLLPVTRGWFRRHLWAASISGSLSGLLVSWWWMQSFSLFGEYRTSPTWERYLEALPILAPMTMLTGALYAFLHAFFVRQALAKQEWLAIHPDGPG